MTRRGPLYVWASRGRVRELEEDDGGRLFVPFPVIDREEYRALKGGVSIAPLTREVEPTFEPIAGLIAIQSTISEDRLEEYERGTARASARGLAGGAEIDVPILVKVNGNRYIHDGHHRTCAAWLNGATTIRARLVDLDQKRVARESDSL
jgi:hypothetical protein